LESTVPAESRHLLWYLPIFRKADSPPGLKVRGALKCFSKYIMKCHPRCLGVSEAGRYGTGPTGELCPSGLVVEARQNTLGHLKWHSISA